MGPGRITPETTSPTNGRFKTLKQMQCFLQANRSLARNVLSYVPSTKVREIARMLPAIHAQESREAAARRPRKSRPSRRRFGSARCPSCADSSHSRWLAFTHRYRRTDPFLAEGNLVHLPDRLPSCVDFVGVVVRWVCLANSYYVYKSPQFHRLVDPGGNGTIWVHA